MSQQVIKKINLYSANDLKNNCDDNLPFILSNLGFKQDFKLKDIEIGLSTALALIGGTTYLVDKKLSFSESYNYTVILIVVYFLIQTVFFVFMKFYQADIKYTGINLNNNKDTKDKKNKKNQKDQKDQNIDEEINKIIIKTTINKKQVVPTYNLTIELFDNDSNVKKFDSNLKFSSVFNELGFLQIEEFQKIIKDSIIKTSK
ncbi:signal peptidase complex subunit SPC2 ASCRUDRAFT_71320 [Ascoidea rubescens DSM 1968]|uniref:Signal peptidase complex subunit 2 n=1 Tax=Ascoidea rubescens DSM 1968 TaxID=1344418 RepID=A0A1D2VEC9_9ASCO|nr:hypothetical protein ASCRUDRAFT_71320 [Ascoidea rubescens DSM 1968]ODV59817.1 hypothetical protein ASCRUDRAFT_71320 [Ascoidea rubescens DSM 1968]